VPDPVHERSRLQERLRRDAPAMEARAADLVLGHERDLESQLSATECGGIAARAGAEDD